MFPLIAYLMIVTSNPIYKAVEEAPVQLASHSFSMENRYDNKSVNDIFKYNILLTVERMGNEFTLQPGEVFAFHDNVLPKYEANLVKTTNSRFNSFEKFKSDGYLVGDGVCHLASLINWVAQDAGLDVYVPARHDFAKINDVSREYGVSINSNKSYGNLYITNNKDKPVTFEFNYDGTNLSVSLKHG